MNIPLDAGYCCPKYDRLLSFNPLISFKIMLQVYRCTDEQRLLHYVLDVEQLRCITVMFKRHATTQSFRSLIGHMGDA